MRLSAAIDVAKHTLKPALCDLFIGFPTKTVKPRAGQAIKIFGTHTVVYILAEIPFATPACFVHGRAVGRVHSARRLVGDARLHIAQCSLREVVGSKQLPLIASDEA